MRNLFKSLTDGISNFWYRGGDNLIIYLPYPILSIPFWLKAYYDRDPEALLVALITVVPLGCWSLALFWDDWKWSRKPWKLCDNNQKVT